MEQLIEQKIQEALQKYNFSSLQSTRHTHNGVDSQKLQPKYFINYPTLIAPNFILVTTNGTNPQNIFPSGLAPFGFTYNAILTISNDTTAANIIITNNGNNVTLIPKGTSQYNVQGNAGVGMTNLTQAQGTPATVVSSTTGNAFVIIFFTAL